MNQLAQSRYIKPYPQPALGGCLGLTSYDVALSIRLDHKVIMRRLGERGYAEKLRGVGCNLASVVTKSEGRGRPSHSWVLDSNAAKIFVAQTRTDDGIGYVVYLLECEQITETILPKMLAEVASLREQVALLTAPKVKRVPGVGLVSFIKKIVIETDIFKETRKTVVEERKAYALLTEDERARYRIEHRAKTTLGISKKQDDEINYNGFPRLIEGGKP